MENKKQLIIGGGIAGLTLANVLEQKGQNYAVYEATNSLKPVGLGIWLGVNAMQVLDRLNLSKEILTKGAVVEQLLLYNHQNKLIKRFDLDYFNKKFKHPVISLLRSDLQDVLSKNIPEEKLHFGKRVKEIIQAEKSLKLNFEDGSQENGHFLFGADGIKSSVRQNIFPETKLEKGESCFRGVVSGVKLPDELNNSGVEFWGKGHLFGFSPLPGNKIFWWSIIQSEQIPTSNQSSKEELLKSFADFPETVQRILKKTQKDDIIKSRLYRLPYLSKWHKGGVCVLGDAAHAMEPNLGQGGSMAIESAYQLGELLGEYENDSAEKLFRKFQKKAKRKAHLVKFASEQMHKIARIKKKSVNRIIYFFLRITPTFLDRFFLNSIYKLWRKEKY